MLVSGGKNVVWVPGSAGLPGFSGAGDLRSGTPAATLRVPETRAEQRSKDTGWAEQTILDVEYTMDPEESPTTAEVNPASSQPVHAVGSSAGSPTAIKPGLGVPLWLITLGAGIIAGVLSGLGGEATSRAIPLRMELPANFASISGYQKVAVVAMIAGNATRVAVREKAAAAYGLLGVLLGIGLGLTGGWASGSMRSGWKGALVGGVAGGVAGAALSAVFVPIFFRFQDPDTDAATLGLLLLFFTHAAIFAGIGAASGLALGWGSGDRGTIGQALVGGLLGAIVGTFAFEVINSLLYPMVRTYEPVPTEPTPRMLLHLCVAVGTAVLAGWAAGGARKRSASS
jgi:hypothetical protein